MIQLSGHTDAARTTKRVLSQFSWPTVTRGVSMYCRACAACQRTVDKGHIPSAPLQQMPLIEPFECLVIDLIVPFDPMSERGHRYVLTIVGGTTRVPEAVPLKRIDSPALAEALSSVFSRVCCSTEILSDHVT